MDNNNTCDREETQDWESPLEEHVIHICEKSKRYKELHIKASQKLSMVYNGLMVAGVVLGPLGGLLSGIDAVIQPPENITLAVMSCLVGFLSGTVVAISKFGKFGERSDKHKAAAAEYTRLENTIRRRLVTSPPKKSKGREYLNEVGKTFDQLFADSPLVRGANDTGTVHRSRSRCPRRSPNRRRRTRSASPIRQRIQTTKRRSPPMNANALDLSKIPPDLQYEINRLIALK